jgi:hypothetical protein
MVAKRRRVRRVCETKTKQNNSSTRTELMELAYLIEI